ncbi:class D sortase [Alkaliphilus peptidifermentans]|uniref:Sortase A n=1 Tax=Alkaliphilus peptidifermentans DSM 18978 TaxID=1120976 RepID=A0A1G5AM07_9FIRM|nr:class D sortase [Alkaliphilus peptidifermentans]SCX78870.1 sortase A [Alkaliphilus peptidifermentans DSM 18978]
MKKAISTLLIIIGIAIFLYPFIDRGFTRYMQNKAMKEYERILLQAELTETSAMTQDFIDLQGLLENEMRELMETQPETEEEEVKKPKQTILPIGILKIDKIKLNLPILEGTSELNLKIGAGWLRATTPIGEVGNTALAAHRSHTYGRFFNRLDEIEIGDEIIVEKDNKTYKYIVYKTDLVLPEDTSVLNRNQKDKILTLITCHPIDTATHRLIVHAILNE